MANKSASKGGERIAGIGSEAVQNATGKGWKEWLVILDREKATSMTHQEIDCLLYEKYGVPGWWAQMITVGYEQARGLRVKHERPEGFEIGRNKTIAAPAITIRKATPEKSLRITWVDGKTNLDINLWPRGEKKTMVSVQHGKLPDARAAERMKKYWGQQLERPQALLEK